MQYQPLCHKKVAAPECGAAKNPLSGHIIGYQTQ